MELSHCATLAGPGRAITVAADVPLDCVLLWEALTADSGADVAIVDAEGVLLRISERPRFWPVTRGDIGKKIADLFSPDIAQERLAVLRHCVRSNRPVAVHAIWRGTPVRSVMRPFVTPEGRTLVLVTARAGTNLIDGSDAAIETLKMQSNDADPLAKLTPREIEVLGLIGQGHTTADIAKMLFRSAKTIEAHRLSLGLKLKVKNRVELARIAIRAGLIDRR